jgi:hypothetical protein
VQNHSRIQQQKKCGVRYQYGGVAAEGWIFHTQNHNVGKDELGK